VVDGERQGERDEELRHELAAPGQAEAAAPGELDEIVREPDGAERQERREGDPDEAVGQVHPEESREDDGEQDEHSSHRRHAGLGLVRRRPAFADRLADLPADQEPDHGGSEHEREEERRDRRHRGAERDVPEDIERRDVFGEGVEELVQHQFSSALPAIQLTAITRGSSPTWKSAARRRDRGRRRAKP
jgi:hypothetical protein